MKLLGIITARAGSKRVPGKNMADLGGKPLVRWSIDCGLATCEQLAISTDDPVLADYAAAVPGVRVIHRPPELSRDETPSGPVVIHAAAKCDGWDAAVLLQPTSPFRTADDVVAARQIAERFGWNVISVTKDAHQDDLCTIGAAGRLRAVCPSTTVYRVNGAIYLIWREGLLSGEDWYALASCYVMPAQRSIDIDTHSDMDAARRLLAERAHLVE